MKGAFEASARSHAAALKLRVAQAAFSERAPWVVRAGVDCVRVCRRALRRRLSPRLCGWLRGVSLRATSPAAAAAQCGGRGRARLGRSVWEALRAVRAWEDRDGVARFGVVASARICAGGCARSAFGPPRQRRRRRWEGRGAGKSGGSEATKVPRLRRARSRRSLN